MRLLRQLQALEKRRGGVAAGQAIGLAWVSSEELDPWESTAGVVADVYEQHAEGELDRWRLVLRKAEGPGDLGRVYDRGGDLCGVVRRLDGSLIEIEPCAASGPVPPVAPDAAPLKRKRAAAAPAAGRDRSQAPLGGVRGSRGRLRAPEVEPEASSA